MFDEFVDLSCHVDGIGVMFFFKITALPGKTHLLKISQMILNPKERNFGQWSLSRTPSIQGPIMNKYH